MNAVGAQPGGPAPEPAGVAPDGTPPPGPALELLDAEPLPDLSRQVMLLRVGDQRVGLAVGEIGAVLDEARLSVVPKAPAGVLGIMNHLGSVLTVVSLAAVLGLPEPAGAARQEPAAGARTAPFVVVVERRGERIGLRVDRVEGVTLTVDLDRDVVAELEGRPGRPGPFSRGWLVHEEAPVRLLDGDALIDEVMARFERRDRRA